MPWPEDFNPRERESSSAKTLSGLFEQAGVKSRVVQVENNDEFPEVLILEKETPQQKTVRLYRGIGRLDVSILRQVPYAMRAESETGEPVIIEDVRQEVEALVQNPTYENLLTYVNKVSTFLSPGEVDRLDRDLTIIEDWALKGFSVRGSLIQKQIEHGGGWAGSGITPYASASYDPEEAAKYGRKGVVIIDLPISEIEDFNTRSRGEVNIKGEIKKEYLTAILLRGNRREEDTDRAQQQILRAVKKVDELLPIPFYTESELQNERERKLFERTKQDKEQEPKDLEAIRKRRVIKLVQSFPEVEIETSGRNGEDYYTKAKEQIFDYYKDRLEKTGNRNRRIEDYEYQESEYGGYGKFDREKINETMLFKLKGLVLRLENRNRRKGT